MKKIFIFSITAFFIYTDSSFCQIVSIDDVEIIPNQPLPYENISIQVDGEFTHCGVRFDESIFTVNNQTWQLDIYFTEGFGPSIPEPWSHDENISALPLGSYDLLVQAYWRSSPEYNYILHDSYPTNFDVIPEPAAFLIYAFNQRAGQNRKIERDKSG